MTQRLEERKSLGRVMNAVRGRLGVTEGSRVGRTGPVHLQYDPKLIGRQSARRVGVGATCVESVHMKMMCMMASPGGTDLISVKAYFELRYPSRCGPRLARVSRDDCSEGGICQPGGDAAPGVISPSSAPHSALQQQRNPTTEGNSHVRTLQP